MRNPGKRFVRRANHPLGALSLALVVSAVALGACAKHITEVDPSYTQPEGRLSADAQLVVWNDASVKMDLYSDLGGHQGPDEVPTCPHRRVPDIFDRLIDSTFDARSGVNLAILDRTPATAFRPMRREANGGYRALVDYPVAPVRKWLDAQWEIYRFVDAAPSGFTPPTYVGRGLVGGVEGADTPLTNEALLPTTPLQDVTYAGNCLPCDSLFTIRWQPIAGAARVWIHVYQFAAGVSDAEIRASAHPSPVNVVRPRDFLIVSLPGDATSYRLGDRTRTDVNRVLERTTNFGQTYHVRISAVDSTGYLTAFSRGDYGVEDRGEVYGLFRLGAFLVNPKRVGPNFPFCQPETP